ncbi:MAG TPA: bifunctional oligoribonuclease/PAP phosphatase NrnA [Firmicutes bacterium]|nr:bifunctional oligoribonuclease/PAP phosphatase NrnA [Bacillota bacterium]
MSIHQEIIKKIEEFNTIIIHRHVIPDGDAMGSQVGLSEIIKTTYPEKEVYIVGEELAYLGYVGKMDQIDDSKYEGALVIIVDTANAPRISDERYNLGAYKIKIDHHPNHDHYADLEWVDTTYPACCEMIAEFLISNNLKCSEKGAFAIFNGMVSDTGRFLYRGVSERTFRHVAELLAYEFDMSALYASMYAQSKELTRFKGYVLLNFKETENGVGYVKFDDALLKELQITEVEASANVNTLANIVGIKIWAFFVENIESKDVRVNLRSAGAPVNSIAIKYGGGGHLQAAGARAKDFATVDQIIADLDELAKEY